MDTFVWFLGGVLIFFMVEFFVLRTIIAHFNKIDELSYRGDHVFRYRVLKLFKIE